MLRAPLLYLADQPLLKRFLSGSLARPLVRRFVAGESLSEALTALQQLNETGLSATLDYLGESVASPQDAYQATAQYIGMLHAIERHQANSNVSLKLTQLGLDIDYDLCLKNVSRVVAQAAEFKNFVRIDMESSAYTEVTLQMLRDIFAQYTNVGVVIQAYLYRSEQDIELLNSMQARVRLCKGAYNEPERVAFPKKEDTDANFIKLMQMLLSHGNYPGIATHDEAMINATCEYAEQQQISPDRFEFQMLYGIRRDLQEKLINQGYRVRVYVPFGKEWYPYLVRRLAERPANIAFVLRGVFGERSK
jgi:proline dehydrogenase